MGERYNKAIVLLGQLKTAMEAVNTFVVNNEVAIREVTGMVPIDGCATQNIYTTSAAKSLILQFYADTLGRNLGKPSIERLPA